MTSLALLSLACAVLADFNGLRTEPTLKTQTIDVKFITPNRSRLGDGYLFFSANTWTEGFGPKIYSHDGRMIWDGKDSISHVAQNFHVCDYLGERGKHLCWHETSRLGIARQDQRNVSSASDFQRVIDDSYRRAGGNFSNTGQLQTVDFEGNHVSVSPDSHEFWTVNHGEAYLQTVYPLRQKDLSPWTGPKEGWVRESCFQEVRFADEEILFSWCLLDHHPLETQVYVRTAQQTNFTTDIGGNGEYDAAWDYWHINSVDKNEEGDYLLSGRHNDQIIKVAGHESPNGAPGEILWILGGDSNEFELDQNFTFTRQHHARFVETRAEKTIITLFDNAWEGEDVHHMSSLNSSGKVITVHNVTMRATLDVVLVHPYGKLSQAGGNVQLLPNGNYFVGYGHIRDAVEYSPDGEVIFHAQLLNADFTFATGYRQFKFPWQATPFTPPKLVAYSYNCTHGASADIVAYASWNGATEVVSWRFYGRKAAYRSWKLAGEIPNGIDFEQRVKFSGQFYSHLKVEALDKSGKVLSTASATTFVPNEEALGGCDEDGCYENTFLNYDIQYSCAQSCQISMTAAFGGFALLAICLELGSWLHSYLVCGHGKPAHRARMLTELRYDRLVRISRQRSVVKT